MRIEKTIFQCSQFPILLKKISIIWTFISHCTLRLKVTATLTKAQGRIIFQEYNGL